MLNAIKFTPDHGSITVSAERDGQEGGGGGGGGGRGGVVIRVSDTGCGIDPAHLPHVSEAFFTGYDVTRHSSGHYEHGRQGIGLGLTVVKSFVAMHGGTLDVASELNCGTTVTLFLPPRPPRHGTDPS
jgi:signal transduction histidine kinase